MPGKPGARWGPLHGDNSKTRELAHALRAIVDGHGRTTRELQAATHLGRTAISARLRGDRRPDWPFVAALLKACVGDDRRALALLTVKMEGLWKAADPELAGVRTAHAAAAPEDLEGFVSAPEVAARRSDLAGLNELIGRAEEAIETLLSQCHSLRRENIAREALTEQLQDAMRRRDEAERLLSVLWRMDRTSPPASRMTVRPSALVVAAVGALTAATTALGIGLWLRWGAADVLAMLTNQGAGICFAMVGLSAWRLRPSTPAGLLMTLMAELILISNLAIGLGLATDMPGSSLVVTLGAIAQWALFALAAQLLLGVAAPTTAKAWTPHKLVKIAWMLAAAGPILLLPLKTPVAICGNWCGQSPFHWNDDASLYLSVRSLYMGAWIILAVCGAGVITRRFNQATARQRRTHGLALASAGTVMMLFVLMQLSVLAQYLWADTTINQVGGAIAFTTAIIMVIAVPVAFTAAVLGEQATLAGIAQLLGRAKPLTPPELEEALQTTLRDPSLCLALLPPQSAPFIHSARSQTPIGNPPVGVLLHDRSLLDEPHLLNAAINAAHLVIQQWSSRPLGSERPMA